MSYTGKVCTSTGTCKCTVAAEGGGEHGDEDLPELTGKWSLKAALLVYLARVVDRCFFFFWVQ